MTTETLQSSTAALTAALLPDPRDVPEPLPSDVPRLSVRNLQVGFHTSAGPRTVVEGLSFDLHAGACVAIVGESGSGKSVTARTLVGLPGSGAFVHADRLECAGDDLRTLTPRQWQGVRGERIGFVLQDALGSLDPLRPVGAEIDEAIRLHRRAGRSFPFTGRTARQQQVHDLLTAAGVPRPETRARQRPGELSGGLRQRALIASAIAADPDVLIADEPTTALDATVQAQILDLFAQMKRDGRSLVLISHDLSVVAQLADEVLVMHRGRIVEQGLASRVLTEPAHPYTQALLRAVPSVGTRGTRLSPTSAAEDVSAGPSADGTDSTVLDLRGLCRTFRAPTGAAIVAVHDVSFQVSRGETLGIVGESGSGKSTTARLIMGLDSPDSGAVTLLGEPWSGISERERRRCVPGQRSLRTRISAVYQDPLSSFDPRWDVADILLDALPAGGSPAARHAEVAALLRDVGLAENVAASSPSVLSGGQRQRVAIARAVASQPDVIVLDEAVSALDVSVQAQILDLLQDLQQQRGTAYVFISHDLGVIGHMSDRVLVMKDGQVVEEGVPEQLLSTPTHPYTRSLIQATHRPLPR